MPRKQVNEGAIMSRHHAIAKASILAALWLLVTSGVALAQTGPYPNRPVRVIFGFPPGTDAFVRIVADKLGEALGQPFVIENVTGAAGNIAADRVAKSAPDGYTIGAMTTASISINGSLYARLPYDPLKDFVPVSQVTVTPSILVVNSDTPVRTVDELIALARAKPGELTFGHSGPGTTQHLAGEVLKLKTGINIQQVPYRGPGPISQDLLGGRITMAFQLGGALPLIAQGKLRALAVTSRTRMPQLPDVPTMMEAGFPDFEMTIWTGLLLPAGTPEPIVTRLAVEVRRIMALPEVRRQIEVQGSVPVSNTPEEFAALIKAESAYWAKIIKDTGIPPLN
jgi:tripartite-type tricarboxylate transporter receptor subunit TctC